MSTTEQPECRNNLAFHMVINDSRPVYFNLFFEVQPIPAPLIRFRPWRYINLFTYFLTYLQQF